MDDLDKRIEAKLAEMNQISELKKANSIAHEMNPGEPLVMNTSEDLIRYSILRKRGEKAELEHDILLHEKYGDRAPIDLEKVASEIDRMNQEIEADEKELDR